MTELKAPIQRTSKATRRERGRTRAIVAMMVPPAFVGFRLAGDRQAFLLDIEVAYELAVRQFARDVERLSKRIANSEGLRIASARKLAEKQIRAEYAGVLSGAREQARLDRAERKTLFESVETLGPKAKGGKCPGFPHRHINAKGLCKR